MAHFVLIRERGPAWDWSRPMREQHQWAAHAAFMDALVDDGFIVLGGPLGGEDDAKRVLHIIDAPNVEAVEAKVEEDPWTPLEMLRTVSIEPWTVLLGQVGR